MDDILRESRLTLPILSEVADVDLGYLKQLSAGNSAAGPETRAKLAAGLRKHGATLLALAEQLDADR